MKCRIILYIILGIILIGCKKDPLPPLASFSANTTAPSVGDPVSFNNTSFYASSYDWDFGDGSSSSDENPMHTYTASGTFTVGLTATGEGGNNSTSKTITVSATEPIADFTMSTSNALVDEVIYFTNESQYADSYSWNFGDGSTSTAVNPTHSYSAGNSYTIVLTATNSAGNHTATKVINIANPTVAAFTMNKTSAEVGETISFTNTSSNATSYLWDFGDGATSIAKNPTHSYAAEDIYPVQLTATGPGGVHSVSHNVTIVPAIPINIFPGVGILDLEVGDTWGIISNQVNDWLYLGSYNDGNDLINVLKSPSKQIGGFFISTYNSTEMNSADLCFKLHAIENFVGRTAEGIMIGSSLSDLETAYGPPQTHNTTGNHYYLYNSSGMIYFYNETTLEVKEIGVFTPYAKKSTNYIHQIIDKLPYMDL